jgi:hypothetical protein
MSDAALSKQGASAEPRWPRRKWRALIKEGDWAGALAVAGEKGFEARELTQGPALDIPGSPVQLMAEEAWFAGCADALALEKLIGLAQANPSRTASGAPKEIPSHRALRAALVAGNEAGVTAFKKACPGLFAKNTKRLVSETAPKIWRSKEWEKAQSASQLKERLLLLERSLSPGAFSAQQSIKTLANGGWAAMTHGQGRAGIAKLALDEGLDPMAMSEATANDPGSRAPLAILAMGCQEPDVFMEFVRRGADPSALRLDWHGGRAAGGLSGVMGIDWEGYHWPAELDDNPNANRAKAAASWPFVDPEDETRLKSGLSARQIMEAALQARLSGHGFTTGSGHFAGETAESRVARWRAAWEAWTLAREAGEAADAAKASESGKTQTALARKSPPRV